MNALNEITVRVENFMDRKGNWTTAWFCYFGFNIMSVEYTPGQSALTNRVDFGAFK